MSDGSKQKGKEKGKSQKYQQFCSELRERRPDDKVRTILPVIGCLRDGMKNFKEDVKLLFKNVKEKLYYGRAKQ